MMTVTVGDDDDDATLMVTGQQTNGTHRNREPTLLNMTK